jgi:hypothetical protein
MTAHTSRPLIAALVVVLLVAPAIGGVVVAQDTTPTTTPEPAPTETPTNTPAGTPTPDPEPRGESGEDTDESGLTLSDLREGGTALAGAAPDGARKLDNGAVAITYYPASPLESSRTFLGSGTTLNTNDVSVYSTRFGETVDERDVTLHIAYYEVGEQRTQTESGTTTETVAQNVSVQKVDMSLANGYQMNNVSLVPHYDKSVQLTMWLTDRDGDPIEGARWAGITQRSDPAGQSAGINDKGDLWNFIAFNVFGVGVIGLLGGFGGGKHVLNRIGRGPDLGLATYGIALVVLAFIIGGFAYIYATTILANIPIVWGVLIGLIGFIGFIEVGGPKSRNFLFEQDVLTDATSPTAEDVKDSVYQNARSVKGIRREDGSIGLPADGIRPAIARYFAEPATLDELDLSTHIDMNGGFDQKFIADPDSGDVLVHKPARLKWNPTLVHPTDGETPSGFAAVTDLIERTNWAFIIGSIAFLGGGWVAADALLNFPYLGVAVGALGVWALGTEARDGHAAFEPAPIHYRSAKATVQNLAVEYDDAKTIEEAEKERWKAEATTASEIQARQERQDKTVSQRLAEESAGIEIGGSEATTPMPETERDHREDDREKRQKEAGNGHEPASDGGGDGGEDGDDEGWKDA